MLRSLATHMANYAIGVPLSIDSLVRMQVTLVAEAPIQQSLQDSQPRAEVLDNQNRDARIEDHLFGDAAQQDG
jgi:hypothetical protein